MPAASILALPDVADRWPFSRHPIPSRHGRQATVGVLLAHFAVRGLMHAAALPAGEDPDRLSFLHAVRVVRRKLARFASLPPAGSTRVPWNRPAGPPGRTRGLGPRPVQPTRRAAQDEQRPAASADADAYHSLDHRESHQNPYINSIGASVVVWATTAWCSDRPGHPCSAERCGPLRNGHSRGLGVRPLELGFRSKGTPRRKASVTERASAVLIQEETMEPPGGPQTPGKETHGPCIGHGCRVGREWAAPQPGHRVVRER